MGTRASTDYGSLCPTGANTSSHGPLTPIAPRLWGEWLLAQSSRGVLVAMTVAHGDAVTEEIPAKLVEAAARVGVKP